MPTREDDNVCAQGMAEARLRRQSKVSGER
jgi:hypothetical protein